MTICQKKQKWLSEFQELPEDVQQWEIAWYLHQLELRREAFTALEDSQKTTNKKGEPVLRDMGAFIAIQLARLEL